MKSLVRFKITVFILFGFACLMLNMRVNAEDIVIIAHKNFPVDSISADDLERLYLGKTRTLGDNKAFPITLKEGSVHDTFLDIYLKKNANQFSSYWKKILFTGKGKPPKSAKSDDEMIKLVSENEMSIGYIAASSVTDAIKVLKIK